MFIVMTGHGWGDMSIPTNAVRAITDEPIKAFEFAKELQKKVEEKANHVTIFEFSADQIHDLKVFRQLGDDPLAGVWMYVSWPHPSEGRWVEKWNDKFKELVDELAPA